MASHPFQNFAVKFRSGETVFVEGEVGATMYVVHSGRVQLYREVDGQRRSIGIMEKGDFFGEMSILEGLPRTLSSEAVEDCELIEINSSTFDKMIRSNIEIAIRMLRKLCIRLRETERKLSESGVVTARESVAAPSPAARTAVSAGARLEIEGESAAFGLVSSETLIGRYDPVTELRPDIDLTDLDLKRTVSRRHARVVRQNEAWAILEEIGALNGTFVNSTRLVPGQPQPIVDGDRVSLGMVSLVFRL